MKKSLIILAVYLGIMILITGCGIASTTIPTPNISSGQSPGLTIPISSPRISPSLTQPEQRTIVTPSNMTPSNAQSQYGGVFRIAVNFGPRVLGGLYLGPNDLLFLYPGMERLMDTSPDRSNGIGLEPVLAQSVEDDIPNKRIVFHLRPGVKFHDGSDLNSDVVIWTFQRMLDAGVLQYASYWKGIRKLDDLSVEIYYTEYTNQLIQSWGITPITSKAAYEKASGGNPQKGVAWETTNFVGTGPFMLKEYRPGERLTWVKNPDYWQKGKPYLDSIEYYVISDAVTTRLLMLSGGADYWLSAPVNPNGDLVKQGFQIETSWVKQLASIWPNTADPRSKWNNIRLRQALEYAIDKSALVKAFGPNYMISAPMLAPPGEWGYDPNYPARTYDPQKARDLIKQAGYPSGIKAKLLVDSETPSIVFGTAIKQYLDAVGFQIELDIADSNRYFATIYGKNPGSDLCLTSTGMDNNYLLTYMRWFSTDPFINLSYLGHTTEQQALDEEAKRIPDATEQKEMTGKLISYMTDNAFVIPVFWHPISSYTASYVHSGLYSGIRWRTEDIWMEKH